MLNSVLLLVPMRQIGVPAASTLSENCTCAESFPQKLLSALPRIHSRYALPASAGNVSSK
jgi:hypothetical protein